MTGEASAGTTRRRRIIWFTTGMMFAVLFAWLGARGLNPLLQGSATGAKLIEFRPYQFMSLPLALAGLVFAAMELVPRPDPKRRGRKSGKRSRALDILFGLFALCAISIPAAPLVGRMILEHTLTSRGYRQCSEGEGRRPPRRWVRVDLACPE